jgi:hypothetical protein
MTSDDRFFAVFISFSSVFWQFPFMVDRLRSRFFQIWQNNRTGQDFKALAMMREMEKILGNREIPFNAKDSRVMCFPHIINIAVQHVLAKMTSAPVLNSDSDASDTDDQDDSINLESNPLADKRGRTQTFELAFAADPIGRCRKLVVKLRSSGQIKDDFNNWVKAGNEKNWFKIKGKPVKLPHKEFLRDVPTKWDSSYQMIKRCIEMRPVCSY